jgi:N utilization substance protein A
VIEWSEDASTFVAKALSPAQVIEVRIDEEHRIANVVVPERMLSLAIGREGQNARLAAKLTGWRIDIRSDVSVAEAAKAEATLAAEAKADVGAPAQTGAPLEEAPLGVADAASEPAPAGKAKPKRVKAAVEPPAEPAPEGKAKPKRVKAAVEPSAEPAPEVPAKPKRARAAAKVAAEPPGEPAAITEEVAP